MGRGDNLRIGDQERERAIAMLGKHFAAGRLDVHEYDTRCAGAASAQFGRDLLPLFDDLPAPRPDDLATQRTPAHARRAAGLLAVAIVVLLLSIEARQLWLLAVFAVAVALWFARPFRARRRHE